MAPWPHPQGGGAGRGDRLGRAISARPAEAGPVMEMAVMRDPRHEAGPIAEPILIFHPLIRPLFERGARNDDAAIAASHSSVASSAPSPRPPR